MNLTSIRRNRSINLGLGCANFGCDYNGNHLSYYAAKELVDYAVTLGIRTFDTASQYGLSEIYLKHALKGYKRPFCIITKFHRTDWRKQVLRSVERFKGHDLTILWHNWSPEARNIPIMDQMIKLSKIHNFRFGASTYGFHDANRAILSDYFDFVEIEFNLLNWKAQYNLFTIAAANKVNLILRSILARGFLVRNEKSPFHDLARKHEIPIDEMALRYIREFVNWETVLIGAENSEQLLNNVQNLSKLFLPFDLITELKEIDFERDMRNL